MSFSDYIKLVNAYTQYGGMRKGQACMIALGLLRPDLYRKVVGSERDCFYQDEREPEFWAWLGENWDEVKITGKEGGE